MKLILLLPLTLLIGCAGLPQSDKDFFARQSDFAADRQRESIRIDSANPEITTRHVIEALMDLDCALQESSQTLGLISATSTYRFILPETFIDTPSVWRGCAGHRVTVTVNADGQDRSVVRASFDPPSEAADRAFRTLLRNSLTFEHDAEKQHAR